MNPTKMLPVTVVVRGIQYHDNQASVIDVHVHRIIVEHILQPRFEVQMSGNEVQNPQVVAVTATLYITVELQT